MLDNAPCTNRNAHNWKNRDSLGVLGDVRTKFRSGANLRRAGWQRARLAHSGKWGAIQPTRLPTDKNLRPTPSRESRPVAP